MRDNRRTRLILALLLLTAFTLITLDYRLHGGGFFGSARRVGSAIFGPIERAAADVVRPVRDAIDTLGSVGSQRKKIHELERQVQSLQSQLRQAPFDQHRVEELDRILHVASAGQYELVPAQVIAVGRGDGFEWTATIDAGSRDGITSGLTVLNGDGLVGRVTVVSADTSTVVLAIDPKFNVGVRLPNGAVGVVSGRGRSAMSLQLIDPSVRVAPGTGLVTAGSVNERPFVRGVPVGTVTAVTTPLAGEVQTGSVRPFVDFATLDLVGVVVGPIRTDPRSALLPSPSPAPQPASQPTGPASQPSGPASPSLGPVSQPAGPLSRPTSHG
ncbi:MAG: rod shape-determining protein MreC [Acidothermus sp.]|nr:rod shape-determining protein MreC [Acidothermus sp.]MCL6537944.1 rod shape-determining protein MreC [Acidothermus sp.]